MTKTLIICGHMDDESISCGGLIQNREHVDVLALFGRVYDYGREPVEKSFHQENIDFNTACSLLGVKARHCSNLKEGEPHVHSYYEVLERIEGRLSYEAYSEVIIPRATDLNQDHRFLNQVCHIALRSSALKGKIVVREAIALDGTVSAPNYFQTMTFAQLETKVKAVNAYRRERRGGHSPRASHVIRSQAHVWGAMCNQALAEGYITVKEIN